MFNLAHRWISSGLIVGLMGLWLGCFMPTAFADEAKPAAHPEAAKDAAHLPAGAAAHPPAVEAAHAPAGEHKQESPIKWDNDLALWSLIVFVLFATILRAFAWGPLQKALATRENTIKGNIVHAEDARVKAEKMLAEYQAKLAAAQDEVLKVLAEARRDAEHTRQEIMAQTEKDVTAMKERAIQDIQRTTDKALEELFNHMAGTVANATEHVLGRALTDADQDRLIGEALAGFNRGQAS